MQHALAALERLLVEDDGQDLLEYGLLAVLIAVVAVAGVGTLGKTIFTVFWDVIGNAVF